MQDGKPAINAMVENADKCEELYSLVCELGFELVPGIANLRCIKCTTPQELDRVRNPIARFFDAQGQFAN